MPRYLLILGLSFVALLASAAGFARLVDPYGYWGQPDIAGFNHFKPEANRHLDAVKHAHYRRAAPRTLIAGNSRVEVGLDPASPLWPPAMRPVYNFGQPGTGLVGNVAAAISAAEAHRPDMILIGIDFLDFRVTAADWRTPYDPPRAAPHVTPPGEIWSMLVSLDAIEDAVATIAAQSSRFPGTVTPLGYNGLGEYNGLVAAEGHAALFAQRNAENVGRFLMPGKRIAMPGPGANPNWAALGHLADYCRRRGIVLRLFTYPYHEDLLLSFVRTGLGPDLRRWRWMLAAFGDARQLGIYDFMAYDPITTEPVPLAGDTRTRMRWYWEAGHFKAALGDRMIATMIAAKPYGYLLTAASEPAATAALFDGLAAVVRTDDAHRRIDRALAQARNRQ